MKGVVVVEDNQDIALVLTKRLEQELYSVTGLKDGWAAIAYLVQRKDQPDALILDLMPPGRSGVELFSTIQHTRPGTKIFVFTAYQRHGARYAGHTLAGTS